MDDFHEIWYFDYYSKSQVLWKSDKNKRHSTRRPEYTFDHISLNSSYNEMFRTNVVQKIKTHFMLKKVFPQKSCRLWDIVENYCTAGQTTDDNMAHAYSMLDTQGYKHTFRICNTYCFSTATKFARTRLNITLYVHCLSCNITFSPMYDIQSTVLYFLELSHQNIL